MFQDAQGNFGQGWQPGRDHAQKKAVAHNGNVANLHPRDGIGGRVDKENAQRRAGADALHQP